MTAHAKPMHQCGIKKLGRPAFNHITVKAIAATPRGEIVRSRHVRSLAASRHVTAIAASRRQGEVSG